MEMENLSKVASTLEVIQSNVVTKDQDKRQTYGDKKWFQGK